LQPEPGIRPFWSKMNAYHIALAVVVVSVLAAPASRTTMLGPTPISKPSLLFRY